SGHEAAVPLPDPEEVAAVGVPLLALGIAAAAACVASVVCALAVLGGAVVVGGTAYLIITHPSRQSDRVTIVSSCKCPQAVRIGSSRKEMPFGDRYAG